MLAKRKYSTRSFHMSVCSLGRRSLKRSFYYLRTRQKRTIREQKEGSSSPLHARSTSGLLFTSVFLAFDCFSEVYTQELCFYDAAISISADSPHITPPQHPPPERIAKVSNVSCSTTEYTLALLASHSQVALACKVFPNWCLSRRQ